MLPALVLALATAPPVPNVVLVTFDTLRADYLSPYGNRRVETLTADRLAREGVTVDDAVAHVPQTRPSHGSILTGLYPWAHGIRDNYSPRIDPKIPTLATVLKAKGYATGAFISSYVLNATSGLDRGFDVYDDPFGTSHPRGRGIGRLDRPANEAVDAALSWMKAHERRPFFLWLHLYDPHAPYKPPAPYNKRFASDPYAGEVSFADAQLGRVLKRLDEAGLRARTLLVATSDHGEGLGQHGEEEHLLFLYESTQHVPLFFSWPGVLPQGARLAGQFRHVDLLPTMLDLLGVPWPGALAGQSRAANLRSGARIADNEAPMEALYGALHFGYAPLRALRAEGWKFVDAPRPELYNLREDPREENNLVELRSQVADAMRRRLLTYDPGAAEKPRLETAVDPETSQRLAALGYVGGAVPLGGAASGADPKDKVAEFQFVRRLVRQAQGLFEANQLDAAMAAVRRLQAARMSSFDVKVLAARIAAAKGLHDRAISAYEDLLRSAPHSIDVYVELARVHERRKDHARALETLDRGLQREPERLSLLLEKGLVLLHKGDLVGAEGFLERVKRREPDNTRVREAVATLRREKGDLSAAIAEMTAAVKADPRFGDGWRFLGETYERRREWAEAARAFERAIRINARDTAALFALGRVSGHTDPAKALTAFERLVAIDPGYPGISDALRDAREAVPVPVRIIRVGDREAAEAIAAALASGADFAEVARRQSTDPSAAAGGLIVARPSSLGADLREIVMALRPGQVSPVTATPDGYVIVRREPS